MISKSSITYPSTYPVTRQSSIVNFLPPARNSFLIIVPLEFHVVSTHAPQPHYQITNEISAIYLYTLKSLTGQLYSTIMNIMKTPIMPYNKIDFS